MYTVKKMNVVYRYKDQSYYTKQVYEKITENSYKFNYTFKSII